MDETIATAEDEDVDKIAANSDETLIVQRRNQLLEQKLR